MTSGGFSKGDAGWSGEVELGEDPRLVILMGRSPDAKGILDLGLGAGTGGAPGRYLVRFAELGERPSVVRGTGASRTLESWRVPSPGSGEAAHRALDPEEVERLRALGYLR
jgi:hypothetical protein